MSALDPAPAVPGTATPQVPGSPQRRGFLVWFVLAWFGVNLAGPALAVVAIPRALAAFDEATKTVTLSLVSAVGGIAVIVITPLFGRLSDRTTSRLGMRRPWMLWGVAGGLVGVGILAAAPGPWAIVLGWCTAQIGFGATNMAVHALLADQIPTRIRARVAGVASASAGLALIVGSVVVAALPDDARSSWFLLPGGVGGLLALPLALTLRDLVRTERPPRLRPADVLGSYWLDPVRHRDFFWAFACRILVTMSLLTVSTYLLYFVTDHLGVPADRAPGLVASAITVFTLGNIATAVLFGWVSDRTGRRKPIVWISCMLSAAGLVVAIAVPHPSVLFAAMALVGAAQGAYVAVDVALMTEVLPTFDEAGRDLGIVALSYQLPQLLVPVVALPLLALPSGLDYPALFGAAIVFCVVGGLAVLPIRRVR